MLLCYCEVCQLEVSNTWTPITNDVLWREYKLLNTGFYMVIYAKQSFNLYIFFYQTDFVLLVKLLSLWYKNVNENKWWDNLINMMFHRQTPRYIVVFYSNQQLTVASMVPLKFVTQFNLTNITCLNHVTSIK